MYSESSGSKILFFISDIVSILGSFYLLSWPFSFVSVFNLKGLLPFVVAFVSVLFSLLANDYTYIHQRSSIQEIPYIFKFTGEFLLAFIMVLTVAYLPERSFTLSPFWLLKLLLLVFLLTSFFRLAVHYLSKKINQTEKKIILLTRFTDQAKTEALLKRQNCQVAAYMSRQQRAAQIDLPLLQDFAAVKTFLRHHEVNAVYVDSDAKQDYLLWQEYFTILGLPVSAEALELQKNGFRKVSINPYSWPKILTYSFTSADYRFLCLKRMLDVLLSLFGLVFTAAVALCIYPIVQKQSKGPLFFKQKRVGQNGKIFEIYKFRSMYIDAEERKKDLLAVNNVTTAHMFKMDNDPRVFPFGRKLRDWSIDELPQFINVLKGEMSLVGTRPPTVDEYQKYELHHFKRLAMKPGITGMWQVSGRSNIKDFEKVVALDLAYIEHWSVWLDIKIILKTFKVVLMRDGSK
ncbi:sugar transferase [Streptococcus sp. H49]|uniref:sugar transferase n=1 Tax=Streptococcus huangxiaojuni TaxID=3237239 RepID=UPI0034A1AABB